MKSRGAYTIIELVMVMVLLAIVAVISFANISSYRFQTLRIAAERLAGDLRYAKELSLASARWHGASFQVTPINRYNLYLTDGSTDTLIKSPQDPGRDLVVAVADEYQGVTIASVNIAGGNKVEFSPLGVPYNDKNDSAIVGNGTITLTNGTNSVNVVIATQSGRIFLQ